MPSNSHNVRNGICQGSGQDHLMMVTGGGLGGVGTLIGSESPWGTSLWCHFGESRSLAFFQEATFAFVYGDIQWCPLMSTWRALKGVLWRTLKKFAWMVLSCNHPAHSLPGTSSNVWSNDVLLRFCCAWMTDRKVQNDTEISQIAFRGMHL